jgi:hypothetical protein
MTFGHCFVFFFHPSWLRAKETPRVLSMCDGLSAGKKYKKKKNKAEGMWGRVFVCLHPCGLCFFESFS